ncbi:SGNH/GDSL hydrolase family protein [Mucilaginibacter sp. JRF]|uniref:SGNH/GDSL hydrolase family protein n=1 Tax=Mucilaginibacter sp. JRF TaxID=2780088 RepID=UPI00187E6788|nr:SGNH/GDSL hydrolase family protein [Mucilaginibacter sp. JRF]MBE9584165.1 SGNH/GDSL hydrolase family protein [Mucilaginibacter sp. JRF]
MKIIFAAALLLLLASCRKTNDDASSTSRVKVINEGIPKYTSADVAAEVDGMLTEKPKLVVLMIGTNDVSRMGPYSDYADNLTHIIGRIKHAGARVLLMSPPPRGIDVITSPDYFLNDRNDTIETINDSLARELNCYYLNINKAFKDAGTPNATKNSMVYNAINNASKPDGIHLTITGKEFIADTLAAYIKQNFTEDEYLIVVCMGDSLTAGGSTGYPAYLQKKLRAK